MSHSKNNSNPEGFHIRYPKSNEGVDPECRKGGGGGEGGLLGVSVGGRVSNRAKLEMSAFLYLFRMAREWIWR